MKLREGKGEKDESNHCQQNKILGSNRVKNLRFLKIVLIIPYLLLPGEDIIITYSSPPNSFAAPPKTRCVLSTLG